MKQKVIFFIVHELEPKKIWVFGNEQTKPNTDFQQPQDVCFLEKYNELSEFVVFDQKLRYIADQNEPREDHVKMNFEFFKSRYEYYRKST